MNNRRKLKLAATIDGVGQNFVGWQHLDMPSDASENIDFYTQQAKLTESGKFDTFFLINVSHVGHYYQPLSKNQHYILMFNIAL